MSVPYDDSVGVEVSSDSFWEVKPGTLLVMQSPASVLAACVLVEMMR